MTNVVAAAWDDAGCLVVAGQGLLTLWKEQGPVLHCHFLRSLARMAGFGDASQ